MAFILKLAREFCRPDWRAMLSELSSSELSDWVLFFRENYFFYSQIDAHFSRLSHLVLSMMGKNSMTSADFSLYNPSRNDTTVPEEELASLAGTLPGGVSYVPVSG